MSTWENPAAWYDVLNPWGPSDDFYLGLVMSADRVLDVGCGTGRLLHRAREVGHTGRLCGLDPDPAMLDQVRVRTDIEWVLADAASAAWDRDFDLAVMASHAFQVFVEDDQLRESLSAIRATLVDGGRFAFETRNPRARAWERWNTSFDIRNPDGEVARVGSSSTSSSAIGIGARSRKRAKRSSRSRGALHGPERKPAAQGTFLNTGLPESPFAGSTVRTFPT